ncbi:MAG: OmpA family protein [Flavobacteriales bacterium]
MLKQLGIIALGSTLMLGACVSGRQYEELETRKNAIQNENNALTAQNETLSTANRELEGKLADQDERIQALQTDTTLLGNSLRQMQQQYDKINQLNELLGSKNSKLLQDAADENRKLLEELDVARNDLQAKEDRLNALEKDLDAQEANLTQLATELESRESRVKELEESMAAKDAAAQALRQKVADALLGFKDKGLTVEQRDGKVYVSMEAKLLFPSGSTKVSSEGKQAIMDLASAVEGQSDLEIIVEGHTDTDQLRSNNIPRNNWELSVLRATAVVEIMTANSSIDPQILAASGRSEYHPVDPEDKARNRRIEIVLSPNLDALFELLQE